MARMRTLGLTILWVFACSFCTAGRVPVQPGFNARRVSGKWYSIQLVVDTGEMRKIKIAERTAVILENGDIDMHVEARRNGECTTKITRFFHTDQPGKYKTQVGNTVCIVETDYDTYCILHVQTKHLQALHLEARDREASHYAKEKFKEVAAFLGFPLHKIIDMPQTIPCS